MSEGDEGWSEGAHTSFLAAEYQPNAFEVNVAMAERFAPGAEVKADVSGRYYFGAPLGAAQAKWTLQYAEEPFAPEGLGDYHFGGEEQSEQKPLTLRGEGALGS